MMRIGIGRRPMILNDKAMKEDGGWCYGNIEHAIRCRKI
jgi:hypothetical protein